jgi:hypothetical protein
MMKNNLKLIDLKEELALKKEEIKVKLLLEEVCKQI